MPIYEYICHGCNHEFEELVQSAAKANHVACPQCHGKKTDRKISVFSAGRAESPSFAPAGCGRCGDPNGPCAMP
jgi:putative FmdB family regulatory protein